MVVKYYTILGDGCKVRGILVIVLDWIHLGRVVDMVVDKLVGIQWGYCDVIFCNICICICFVYCDRDDILD